MLARLPDQAVSRPDARGPAAEAAYPARGGLVPPQRGSHLRAGLRQLPGHREAQRIASDERATTMDRGRRRLERAVPTVAQGLPHRASVRTSGPERAGTTHGARGPAGRILRHAARGLGVSYLPARPEQ